jgi:hypothetical protein
MKRFLIGLLVLPLMLGCGTTDSTAPNNGAIAGTWDLRSVNGTNLPYVVPTSSTTSNAITTSVLTLSNDGTYNEVTTIEQHDGNTSSTTSVTELGTWSAVNGFVTFDDQTDGLSYTGSISGNTLTETYGSYTSVYSRR